MKIDDNNLAAFLRKEIFSNDTYELKTIWLKKFKPETILDIGANNGFFALYARVLFPDARIICLEPAPETYARLVDNMANLNIECHQYGLGDGYKIKMQPNSHTKDSGSYVGKPSEDGIPTMRLDDICVAYGVKPENSIIKIDCEGGEKHVLDHKPSLDVLGKCPRWMMEVHYHPKLWPDCPRREQFEKFWKDFETTYNYKLHGPFKRQYGMIIADKA